MKISVIITTILIAQVCASFFDVFHGAVLSVQKSFGKLLSDVVTDVKDTVDCTILAVEYVLSFSQDATTRYYDKCGSVTNKSDSVGDLRKDESLPKVEGTVKSPINEECLQTGKPAEINARINETHSKVLDNYKPHDNVLRIENVLAKDSKQLVGVSVLVTKELKKLSNEDTTNLKNIKHRDSEDSVDAILQEIKILETRNENASYTSEANEIHQVIDQFLNKLHKIEATENAKFGDILKDFENNTNKSLVGLRQQFEKWKEEESRHLSKKIKQHKTDYPRSHIRQESNRTQPLIFNADVNRDNIEPTLNSQEISNENTTQIEESLRKIKDSNETSLILVANETSSSENKLNDTVTNTSFSTTENSYGKEIIQPFESPSAIGSSELSTSCKHQSTAQNNVTGDDSNKTMVNNTSPIIDSAPLNETVQPVVNTTNSDKQELKSVTTNKPTTILTLNENNSNDTVIMTNPLQPSEIISLKNVTLPAESNTNSRSSGFAINNDTLIRNTAETAEAKLTSVTQESLANDNSDDTVLISAGNVIVENTSVDTTNSDNVESATAANKLATTQVKSDNIESNDTMITSTPSSTNVSIPINKISANISNEKLLPIAMKIANNDNDSNDTMIMSALLTIGITSVNETIHPKETTTASFKEESTMTITNDKDSNDIIISTTSLSIMECISVTVTIRPEKIATVSSEEESITVSTIINNYLNNTMLTSNSSPIVENTPVSETVEPEEASKTFGNEDSSNDSNETMLSHKTLLIVESTPIGLFSLPISETTTTAYSKDESLTETIKELISTSTIVNDNGLSDTTITNTAPPINTILESKSIQAVGASTVSTSDSVRSTANNTKTPNTADDADSSATVITSTISENISEDNITGAKNEDPLTLTTNSPIVSPATLLENDSNADLTSISFPIAEITTVSEIIEPVKSITCTENKELFCLSANQLATIPNKNTNDNVSSTPKYRQRSRKRNNSNRQNHYGF